MRVLLLLNNKISDRINSRLSELNKNTKKEIIMDANGIVHRISLEVEPHMNGGENLIIETLFIDNGDNDEDSILMNQVITLNSYCNSCQLNLFGNILTPEVLRDLANKIESALNHAKSINNKLG